MLAWRRVKNKSLSYKRSEEPQVKIRPFQLSDQKNVLKLWHLCGLIVSQNNPVQDIDRKLRVNPEWFLVAEIDGDVIATCMAGYEGHRGWINYLAVRPDLQRRGFGKKIMRRAETLLKAAGCPKINLQIRSNNLNVIRFYESMGYMQDPVASLGKRLIPDNCNHAEKNGAAEPPPAAR